MARRSASFWLFGCAFRGGRLAEAPRIGVAARVIGEVVHPGISLRHVLGVAEIEDRRALPDVLRHAVMRAEQLIPEEAGDAVIALLVVEMMSEVKCLDALHEAGARR